MPGQPSLDRQLARGPAAQADEGPRHSRRRSPHGLRSRGGAIANVDARRREGRSAFRQTAADPDTRARVALHSPRCLQETSERIATVRLGRKRLFRGVVCDFQIQHRATGTGRAALAGKRPKAGFEGSQVGKSRSHLRRVGRPYLAATRRPGPRTHIVTVHVDHRTTLSRAAFLFRDMGK